MESCCIGSHTRLVLSEHAVKMHPQHRLSAISNPMPTMASCAPPLLQRMGVQAVMLSGDQPATAHAMAEAVGIPPQQVGVPVRSCAGWLLSGFPADPTRA